MIAKELLVLIVGLFIGGNLGILMMCLMAMAKQADEHVSPVQDLAWIRVRDTLDS